MNKYKVLAIAMCVISLAVAASAKDKEYEDGTLTSVGIIGKEWVTNVTGSGQHEEWVYAFNVQIGDQQYTGKFDSRRDNLVHKNDWASGGPVEVRFEKMHLGFAHGTFMFLKFPNGKDKEIRTLTESGWGRGNKKDKGGK